ncbi:alpha/beta fold hydrolase [Paraburkholderia bannensis]|uniref:alpha/beta fold hydrolase n=1 Tax=Paraburkholderia bannensis TaxID=765414 RepID=UPI002AB1EDE7|nr:alpha/beta fold hydrolase [Paraburkholderia bannensis]
MGAMVDCGEWQVHYDVVGEGDSLILLHGGAPAASGADSYGKNIDELARHFRVHVIDFPGWGRSSSRLVPEGLLANPMEVGAEVIARFMRAVGISKAHILGGSFGGAVALHLVLKHPELVDRLVLAAPAGGETNGPPSSGLVRLLTYYSGEGPTAEKFSELMRHMVHDAQLLSDEMLRGRFHLSCAPERIENFPLRLPTGGVQVPIAPLSGHPGLSDVKAPVLFLWGRNDAVQPIDALASFHRLPVQRAVIFDDCGHWPQWEYPEQFNEEVVKFLS